MSDQYVQGQPSWIDRIIRFCLEQKLVVALIALFIVMWGVLVAPFDWKVGEITRRPVAVDAIPDIGENQQIVYSPWMGRSPKDVDDQVTYPLTVSLLGIPGVKTVRSYSMFGFSMIYVIFEEKVPFEDSQNRIIARLNGLPSGVLPPDVKPSLGPYATALGQIFWYTLEGRDPEGKPAGGWDLHELRTIQDWSIRYQLQSAPGITEVASVGGFVQEYQVDVDPNALRAHGITLEDVYRAVRMSNRDVGARQIELNRVEYLIRARGFIRGVSDIENTVVKVNDRVPITVANVARVVLGPAMREGALDKEGVEAVGGVVVVRHGFNPLEAIRNVKDKIAEITPSLPVKVVVDEERIGRAELESYATAHGFNSFQGQAIDQDAWLRHLNAIPREKWPNGVTTSQVTVVPFYDRTGLIYETLGTLNSALFEQVLITTIVILLMAAHLKSALLISAVMPLSVLMAFIAMKIFGVDANLVSLSGIAIAIGTIVDMGIVITDNIRQHLAAADPLESRLEVVYRATSEVGSAIFTAIATTVVGFLPVFLMTGPEGRLFTPLAFTKTFCLLASVIVALTLIPAAAQLLFTGRIRSPLVKNILAALVMAFGLWIGFRLGWVSGTVLMLAGAWWLWEERAPAALRRAAPALLNALIVLWVGVVLTDHWMPLGVGRGFWPNLFLVALLIALFQGFYFLVEHGYERIMRFFLAHKALFFSIPLTLVVIGYMAWLGFETIFGFVPAWVQKAGGRPESVRQNAVWSFLTHTFPGFGKEFMPPLDEGSFLYMPTTMPHASIGEALDVIAKQDKAIRSIPEVESVVGKIGRAETALDPAPVNMVETLITYKPEYRTDKDGRRMTFRVDRNTGEFVRENGELVPDPKGRPFRQWRESIRSPQDIWEKITEAARIPGTTTAPKLQPIAARIVMLQSGMRAPMGVKVKGPDLESVERGGLAVERFLKDVPQVDPATVIADRIVGKPYLEIDIDRAAIARFGMAMEDVQDAIEVAIGGIPMTTTVEGRKRFPVRVRYMREWRDNLERLERVLVSAMDGGQIPLAQLADIRYVRGPESVKSEDGFLVSYVLFDSKPGHAEVDTVEAADAYLREKIQTGELALPAGVTYRFAGNYENQLHAQKTLSLILPLTLFLIFMLIYFQFRSVVTTGIVFVTIFVCWAGGLTLIWLYGQDWFMNSQALGVDWRELFQIRPINMSIAIWVGFLALFGIASDDGVLVCTYLDQRFRETQPKTIEAVREATVYAGKRRVRACLMTTATTVLALLPVLTSTGRGSDIMLPMSLPSFGGMLAEVFVMFVAAILYAWVRERRLTV